MILKKSSTIKMVLSVLAFFLLVVGVKYFLFASNVPVSLKPVDHRSAKALTRTIAKLAKCKGLEYEQYLDGKILTSFCWKKDLARVPRTSFSINVFFDKQAKSAFIDSYLASEMYKEGDFFVINQDADHGGSPLNPARIKSPYAYAGFPGDFKDQRMDKETSQ